METFFKVLRMIGNYRFLLILSIVLAAVTVVLHAPLCADSVRKCHR